MTEQITTEAGEGRAERSPREHPAAQAWRPEGYAAEHLDGSLAEGRVRRRLPRQPGDEWDAPGLVPVGPALNVRGARTLIAWDRLCLCELAEG